MSLTVGSLFSGIGGIDLGLERAGMTVKWHSEIQPYACQVLKKHWPHVPNIGDITAVNWKEVEHVDVIAGGYPCQPFSTAGQRRGEDDSRHLWPFFRDAISVLRPRYALLENVRGHLSMGGLSVIGDLTAIGYDAEWRIVSAASVGANHRRDRLIVVAYAAREWLNKQRKWEVSEPDIVRRSTNVADTESRYGRDAQPHRLPSVFGQAAKLREPSSNFRSVASWWEIEPDVGRVAHGVPSRVDRLRGLGNAVVPQVAEVIGRLIMEHARHD